MSGLQPMLSCFGVTNFENLAILLLLCSFILNRNILGFSGVEREIVILCNVMLSKMLLDPSLMGFLSKFYCQLSCPIFNGDKVVVSATFLCLVVHNALVALFL
jgi:hypothetical protein